MKKLFVGFLLGFLLTIVLGMTEPNNISKTIEIEKRLDRLERKILGIKLLKKRLLALEKSVKSNRLKLKLKQQQINLWPKEDYHPPANLKQSKSRRDIIRDERSIRRKRRSTSRQRPTRIPKRR